MIDPADLRGRFRWWSVYTQRRAGIDGGKTAVLEPHELDDEHFMLRVRIDGGRLSTEQLRVIGEISQEYARDTADVTDRHRPHPPHRPHPRHPPHRTHLSSGRVVLC